MVGVCLWKKWKWCCVFKSTYCSRVQIGFCYLGLTALRVIIMDMMRVQSCFWLGVDILQQIMWGFPADDRLDRRCLEISLRTERRKTCGALCAGVNKNIPTASRMVENGLSHPQDCILPSENCLPLPFPEPLSKPIPMGWFSPLQGIQECACFWGETCQHLLHLLDPQYILYFLDAWQFCTVNVYPLLNCIFLGLLIVTGLERGILCWFEMCGEYGVPWFNG